MSLDGMSKRRGDAQHSECQAQSLDVQFVLDIMGSMGELW